MHLNDYCPGCGGGIGNQSCVIARCSRQHEEVEYCFQCEEFPCKKYEGIDKYDSFITHQNQIRDLEKAMEIGIDTYITEQCEKEKILKHLLQNYNDGRRKNFFCIAVNLLELQDIRAVMKQMALVMETEELEGKERAVCVVNLFQTKAKERNILLKLNKKPKNKSM